MSTATETARLKTNVRASIEVGNVPIIWGPAGVGKTAMVYAMAEDMKLKTVYTLIGSLCDPTDINGFPVVSQRRVDDAGGRDRPVVEFAPRDWLVRLNETGGMVLFDELTSSPHNVQAAMLTTLQTGQAGDFRIDRRRVAFCAAANPPDIAVNGQELGIPMANRLDHFQFPVTTQAALDWCSEFVGYWGRPVEVGFGDHRLPEAVMINARMKVAGYVRRHPEQWHADLVTQAGAAEESGKKGKKATTQAETSSTMAGSPSPRAWDRVARHVAYCLARGESPVEGVQRYAAAVGYGPAAAFAGYLRDATVPDPEEVLAAPDKYEPSGRVDIDYAAMMGVAAAVLSNATPARYRAGWKVLNVATKGGKTGTPCYEAGAAAAYKLATILRHLDQFNAMMEKGSSEDKKSIGKAAIMNDIRTYSKPFMNLAEELKALN